MAKFCTKCGRPLQEGEVCNCQDQMNNAASQMEQMVGQQQPFNQEQTFNQGPQFQQGYTTMKQPSSANLYFKNLLDTFINVLKTGADAGVKMTQSGDIKIAGGFIVIQAILAALFGIIVQGKVVNYVKEVLSYFSSYDIKMPIAKAFIGTMVLSVVFSLILAVLIFGLNQMFKNTIDFRQSLATAATRSVVVAPVMIMAMLVTVFNVPAGLFIFFIANLWGMFMIEACTPTFDKRTRDLMPLISFIIAIIFAVVAIFIMTKAYGIYLPDTVNSAIKAAGKMDISDLKDLF